MFRKALLPTLALVVLSGCATDYTYRNGNGDYYYGRPQVEYRHIGGYGGGFGYGGYGAYGGYGSGGYGYGGYGGYGYGSPTYYYDRFGRLVYGHPYSAYGSPYSGGYWQYRPRRSHGGHGGGGQDHPDDDDNDNDRNDRRPPWRNIGGMRPGLPDARAIQSQVDRPRGQPTPFAQPSPRPQRAIAPSMRSEGGGSRMGSRSAGDSARARVGSAPPAED